MALVALVSLAMGAAACADGGDDYPMGGGDTGGSGTGGAEGGMGGEGGEGGEGGAPPPPVYCTPTAGEVVDTTCGIFVDVSAPAGGDGSLESPVRTVNAALQKVLPNAPRIYVCKTTVIEEAVDLPSGLDLHGGLDCDAGWAWSLEDRTVWAAPADSISLTTHGVVEEPAVSPMVSGFVIEAPHATVGGGSSVAAVIDGGYITFERMTIVGRDGMSGTPINPGQDANGDSGGDGANGKGSDAAGLGGDSTCGSQGGVGGIFQVLTPFSGSEGEPNQDNAGLSNGQGGTSTCMNGGPGIATLAGIDGADAAGLGTIDVLGFHGVNGTPGTNGGNGGGGGGGGGRYQSAGGGGGAGGCGGIGGVGGTAGGSSIALIVLDASPTFVDVELDVGQAAGGGIGWAGGEGGLAGIGGQGVGTNGCDGGNGANGQPGGGGGSGSGGHAILIAYTGTEPSTEGVFFTPPETLQAGIGPDDAADGIAAVTLAFDLEVEP